MKMHTIWSNEFEEIERIQKAIMEDNPDMTEEEALDEAYETNNGYFDDERSMININVGDEIMIIANLGLWDGNHMAYKLLHSANIRDCMSGTVGDYVTWFVDDRGDLMCRDCHHDGTNLYLYRAWKSGISHAQRSYFMQKVAIGKATRKDITRYTRKIGTYVADVYGWKVRR